jgi:hypothetical protein
MRSSEDLEDIMLRLLNQEQVTQGKVTSQIISSNEVSEVNIEAERSSIVKM